jgi:hypothetical protein
MPADQEQLPGAPAALDEQEQGALDMLLKSHYEPVPPEGYFDSFLASVEEKLEEGLDGASEGKGAGAAAGKKADVKSENAKDTGSNGAEDEEVFFKSSPALEALHIPEPKRAKRTTGMLSVPAAEVAAAAAPPPPEPSGAYRWPVAFVIAAAIGVGGFLMYTKSNKESLAPPRGTIQPTLASGGPSTADPKAGAATTPSSDATMLASAKKLGDAGAGATDDPAKTDDPSGATADTPGAKADPTAKKVARGTSKARRRKRAGTKTAPKVAKAAAKASKKKPAKPTKAPKAGGKKKGDLDSLLDNALGPSGTPKKKAVAKPAKPKGPTTLTMNQIRASMRKLNSRVGACYDKYQVEGTARVKLTITKAGKPKSIRVKGKFFGTDTGACVKKAVQGARFPTFTGKEPSITYPFRLSE